MKKVDLHIHTIPTMSDSAFTFSLDTFKRYVNECGARGATGHALPTGPGRSSNRGCGSTLATDSSLHDQSSLSPEEQAQWVTVIAAVVSFSTGASGNLAP